MGLFTRTERRDAFPYPAIPPNSAAGSVSLRSVSLSRADAAMQKVAIYSSVDLIASLTAELFESGGVFRGTGVDKAKITTPKWLLDIGGQGHGTGDWLWQLLYCWGLRGNGVGRTLERDPVSGQPRLIDLYHPDDVSVIQNVNDPNTVTWTVRGKEIPTRDVFHRRVNPVPGRTLGLSPIAMHAVTISQGLYAQNFGAQWFLDGAHPSAILTNDRATEIDQTTATTVKQRFLAAVRGTREPVVLGNGWKYEAIQIAPGESQFLETQKFTSAECARIYGPGMAELLGYETGGSLTYQNIEQRSVDLLKYSLNRWFNRAEKVLTELLPQPQYFRVNRKALLQTDTLARFMKHQYALKNGLQTINEIRVDEEDLRTVPWGDEPYLPALGPAAAAAAVNADPSAVPENDPAATPTGGQP